jgi:transmembrane sensor
VTNDFDDIATLIGKDLAGEISNEEQATLQHWLSLSEENQQYYRQVKQVFDTSASLKSWQSFDTDEAWRKMRERIHARQGRQDNVRMLSRMTYWRVAASLLLLLSAGYLGYRYWLTPQDRVTVASRTTTEQNTLPDGTQVFLNKSSSIAYEYNPVKKKRRVKLKGEAFFRIAEQKEEQFVLEAHDVIIEDIGTTFNVKAWPGSQQVEVYVESGEVAIYTVDNPGIRVLAGETGVYDRLKKTFTKTGTSDENILAYKTRVFIFRDTEMSSVIETINEVYPVKLRLENKAVEQCTITVTFQDETIDVIADIIAETLKLTIEKTETEILLKGNECSK